MDFTFLDLNMLWFVLVGVLFIGYAMLDGFDLGVGAMHLFAKSDEDRRVALNAIGPVWDGNEVWLVTGAGALFAAFPDVYATLASGLYMVVMLLLCCLIFRAVSIEFRSKHSSPVWRRTWDTAFFLSSLLASFVLGVAAGNLLVGLPIGPDKEYAGGFWNLFTPSTVLSGLATVALFMMHGTIYLLLKTEGAFEKMIRRWVNPVTWFFGVSLAAAVGVTFYSSPQTTAWLREQPLFYVFPVLGLLALLNIPREVHSGRDLRAMFSSCAVIAILVVMFGFSIFPNLVPSTVNSAYSLTIYNASASATSLNYMLNIALIGLPFVLAYTTVIYWVFRGKVKLTPESY